MLDLIQPPVKPTKKGAGGRSDATNLLVRVRRLLHWAIERDVIDGDPTLEVRKPLLHKGERDRVLDVAARPSPRTTKRASPAARLIAAMPR